MLLSTSSPLDSALRLWPYAPHTILFILGFCFYIWYRISTNPAFVCFIALFNWRSFRPLVLIFSHLFYVDHNQQSPSCLEKMSQLSSLPSQSTIETSRSAFERQSRVALTQYLLSPTLCSELQKQNVWSKRLVHQGSMFKSRPLNFRTSAIK